MFIFYKNKLLLMESETMLSNPYAVAIVLIIIALIILIWAIFIY